MTTAMVVVGHPRPASLNHAVAAAVAEAFRVRGATTHLHDLYAEGFEPAMSCDERRTHKEPGVETELQRHADDLRWAQTLVLVYPT